MYSGFKSQSVPNYRVLSEEQIARMATIIVSAK